jgi:hypothetical protein
MCEECVTPNVDIRDDPKERLTLQKEIYVQTQNWARHNETLIIATNTILLGAAAAIAANFFKNPDSYSRFLPWLPFAIACIGLVMTFYLSWQYKLALTRVVVYEKYFKFHDSCAGIKEIASAHKSFMKTWDETFVPEYLNMPPKFGAASTYFFIFLHLVILLVSSCMLASA